MPPQTAATEDINSVARHHRSSNALAQSTAWSSPLPIELVIFDCDGVLIDSEIISAEVLVSELRAIGIALDVPYVLHNFVGHPYPIVAGKIAAIGGRALPDGFEAQYRIALVAAFERDLRPMDGITAVLDRLAVPFCAATSSSPGRAVRSLQVAGLARYFTDRLYTASMVKHAKPAPDLFLHAAQRMRVAPGHCVVVEDSPLGIAAAKAAGMQAWLFRGGSHMARSTRPVEGFDRAFDTMAEFFVATPSLAR